jgi:diadenosine tetraphosphate (Ap4A) HIT family hydrolase
VARINPDPYAGGRLFALVHRVTGLLDSEEEAMEAVRALEAAGVVPDDIDVFVGEKGARSLDLPGREHGRVIRLLRSLEHAVGDERETNHRIDDALRGGATLLTIKVHKRKNAPDEKERALRILRSLHVHEIHYWGAWSFEDLPNGGSCAFCSLPPERILGENEHAIWILDANPVSPGHSLIVPKRHVESFFEATPQEREAMLALLEPARDHVRKSHAPSGFNIGINEGEAAGQFVQHLHVHLIPRFPGDSHASRGGVRWVIPEKADYWSARSSRT